MVFYIIRAPLNGVLYNGAPLNGTHADLELSLVPCCRPLKLEPGPAQGSTRGRRWTRTCAGTGCARVWGTGATAGADRTQGPNSTFSLSYTFSYVNAHDDMIGNLLSEMVLYSS